MVAATRRKLIRRVSVEPTRVTSPVSMTRKSLACIDSGISPSSSRNRVPPCAASNTPARAATAPVKAPRVWPNSSDSNSVSGMAAQLTAMNGAAARGPE